MFISKKKFEEAINRAKEEQSQRCWEVEEKHRVREDYTRRLDSLEKRIYALEKNAGIIEDTPSCPFAITPRNY